MEPEPEAAAFPILTTQHRVDLARLLAGTGGTVPGATQAVAALRQLRQASDALLQQPGTGVAAVTGAGTETEATCHSGGVSKSGWVQQHTPGSHVEWERRFLVLAGGVLRICESDRPPAAFKSGPLQREAAAGSLLSAAVQEVGVFAPFPQCCVRRWVG
jgi:hypothetical protein